MNVVQLPTELLHSVGIQESTLYRPVVMVVNDKPCGEYQIFVLLISIKLLFLL